MIPRLENTDDNEILFKAYYFQICLEMDSIIQKLSTVPGLAVRSYEKIEPENLEALYNALVRLGAYHGI